MSGQVPLMVPGVLAVVPPGSASGCRGAGTACGVVIGAHVAVGATGSSCPVPGTGFKRWFPARCLGCSEVSRSWHWVQSLTIRGALSATRCHVRHVRCLVWPVEWCPCQRCTGLEQALFSDIGVGLRWVLLLVPRGGSWCLIRYRTSVPLRSDLRGCHSWWSGAYTSGVGEVVPLAVPTAYALMMLHRFGASPGHWVRLVGYTVVPLLLCGANGKAVALGAGNPGTGFDEVVRTEAPVPLPVGLYDLGCLTRDPAWC
jgi:hypothetical protein